MCLIWITADDVIAQFLKYTDLEWHNWVFPRDAVKAQCGDTWIGRLWGSTQSTAFFATCFFTGLAFVSA